MNLSVRDLMNTRPITVHPDDSIRHAFGQLCARHIRHLLVVEGEKLVGIVTDRDIRLALPSLPFVGDLAEMYLRMEDLKVRDIMAQEVATVSPDAPMAVAVDLFLAHVISGLPVVESDRIVGILTETDALRALRQALRAAPVPA